MKSKIFILAVVFVFFCVALSASFGNAQTNRRTKRTTGTTATPKPSPQLTEAEIISLASQTEDENQTASIQNTTTQTETTTQNTNQDNQTVSNLNERITQLETKKEDKDEKQKRLLMNLDILSKVEQRAEVLRTQLFAMIEKQNTLQTRVDQINYDLRPDVIERYGATIGSLRPEIVREARQKTLENEKRNIESLLAQILNTRTILEQNVQKADLMVEKMRFKLEKEIDDAIEEDN